MRKRILTFIISAALIAQSLTAAAYAQTIPDETATGEITASETTPDEIAIRNTESESAPAADEIPATNTDDTISSNIALEPETTASGTSLNTIPDPDSYAGDPYSEPIDDSYLTVNPLYEDIIDIEEAESEIKAIQDEYAATLPSDDSAISEDIIEADGAYSSIETAANYVREKMVNRQSVISLTYSNLTSNDIAAAIIEKATEHTENCTGQEGDALQWVYGTLQTQLSGTVASCKITYTFTFYTDKDEEEKLTKAVNSAVSDMSLYDMDDEYDKILTIYDYIGDHVDYDFEHLSNSSYKKQFTAYAALCEGKAVCQGYAILFYRMCKEAGISARMISGTASGGGHAWNIARIDDYYYNLDITWDGQNPTPTKHDWFLKTNSSFPDHSRDAKYATADFNRTYPMSPTPYDPNTSRSYNVYFIYDIDNVEMESKKIERGQTVSLSGLDIPEKEGYTLAGWYRDKSFQTPWDFSTDTVTSNTYLYAKWEKIKHNISTLSPTITPLRDTPFGYDSTPVTPGLKSVTVVIDGETITLKQNIDYVLSWENNDGIGTAYYVVTGIGDYSGTSRLSFSIVSSDSAEKMKPGEDGEYNDTDGDPWGTIEPKDRPAKIKDIPKGLWVRGIDESGYTYTGKAIKPAVRVYDHNKLLKYGTDYTISYTNTTAAKPASDKLAPTITIKGKGNYSSEAFTQKYTINPRSLTDEAVTVTYTDVYPVSTKGESPALKFSVKYAGSTLKDKNDYTYVIEKTDGGAQTVSKWSDSGNYAIHITAKAGGKGGNYSGELTLPFTVSSLTSISSVKISKIKNQDYTGDKITPAITLTYKGKELVKDTDYTLSYGGEGDNTNVGTGFIIITGTGEYAGSKKVTFKIVGKPISKAVVDKTKFQKAYTFLNKTHEQTTEGLLTYYNANTKGYDALVEGRDFTVSYTNNRNKGTATAIYTGINGYTGTLKKTYKINACNIADTTSNEYKIEVSIPDPQKIQPYTKGGATPRVDVDFIDNSTGTARIIPLEQGRDYTITYKNNNKITTDATFVIKGKGNYTGTFPATLTPKFAIVAKDIKNVRITAPDILINTKSVKYKSTPALYDMSGKKLEAGKDYVKPGNTSYTYVYSTRIKNKDSTYTTRQAGSEVNANDRFIEGKPVYIRCTVKAKETAYTGETSVIYRVFGRDIKNATAKVVYPAGKTSFDLDSDNKNPAVTLNSDKLKVTYSYKVGKKTVTETLVEGTDYIILEDTYKNNNKKGTASVTIMGIGDGDNGKSYGGTKTVKFKVGTKKFKLFGSD